MNRPTFEEILENPYAFIPCKTCGKTPKEKPDIVFHWDASDPIKSCICTTCLNAWWEEMTTYYRFNMLMDGKDLFKE